MGPSVTDSGTVAPGLALRGARPLVTTFDLLYVALFAVAWPIVDYLVSWPAFARRKVVAPAQARAWLWSTTMVQLMAWIVLQGLTEGAESPTT